MVSLEIKASNEKKKTFKAHVAQLISIISMHSSGTAFKELNNKTSFKYGK